MSSAVLEESILMQGVDLKYTEFLFVVVGFCFCFVVDGLNVASTVFQLYSGDQLS